MSETVRQIPPFAPKLKNQRRASPQTVGHPRLAWGTEKGNAESPGQPSVIVAHWSVITRGVLALPSAPNRVHIGSCV